MSAGSSGEWVYIGTAVLALVVASIMFSDTLRGSMDMASAGMRYLYEKTATSVLGQNIELGPLTRWEKDHIGSAKSRWVGGLYNEGNTCFMNSVVQSLASCNTVQEFLATEYGKRAFAAGSSADDMSQNESASNASSPENDGDANVLPPQKLPKTTEKSGNILRDSLYSLISELNIRKDSNHTYSTANLTRAIAELTRWRYTRYTQEDAQEFFQQILLGMEKEMQNVGIKLEKNKPNTPLDGTQATRVGCVKCGEMEGIRRGLLSSIDLNLSPEQSGSIRLEELLEEFIKMETISGVECYRCSLIDYELELRRRSTEDGPMGAMFKQRADQIDSALQAKVIDEKLYAELKPKKLKVLGDKTKQVMLAFPVADVLMIHINRSVFDMRTGYMGKNYTPVVFPMRLDVSPWVISNDDSENSDPKQKMHGIHGDPIWYELKATVIHYGSADFGHYVCFRKDNDGIWWRISDNNVDLSSASQVQRSQGVFMLFYEKYHGTKEHLLEMEEPAPESEEDDSSEDKETKDGSEQSDNFSAIPSPVSSSSSGSSSVEKENDSALVSADKTDITAFDAPL